MKIIGEYNELYNQILGLDLPCGDILLDDGLFKHVNRRHPDCVEYFARIGEIVKNPDIIGTSPDKPNSIELIKQFDLYLLVSVTLDLRKGYLYVSSLYDQTSDKVMRRLSSGRYVRISK